jgi:hypothetical protein
MVVLVAAEVPRRTLPVSAATEGAGAAELAILPSEAVRFAAAARFAITKHEVVVSVAVVVPPLVAIVAAIWCLVKFAKIAVSHANLSFGPEFSGVVTRRTRNEWRGDRMRRSSTCRRGPA